MCAAVGSRRLLTSVRLSAQPPVANVHTNPMLISRVTIESPDNILTENRANPEEAKSLATLARPLQQEPLRASATNPKAAPQGAPTCRVRQSPPCPSDAGAVPRTNVSRSLKGA